MSLPHARHKRPRQFRRKDLVQHFRATHARMNYDRWSLCMRSRAPQDLAAQFAQVNNYEQNEKHPNQSFERPYGASWDGGSDRRRSENSFSSCVAAACDMEAT